MVRVTYDGDPIWRPGTSMIAWSKVAALGSDLVSDVEKFTYPIGTKYLRFGQVMTRITSAGAFTVTVTGTPTSGSYTVTLTDPDTFTTTVITVPYNSSVAAVQALIDASPYVGKIVVSGAGVMPANPHTWTQAGDLLGRKLSLPVFGLGTLAGGTPAGVIAFTVLGDLYGQFGPYDSGASDGRQTLTRGDVGILDESVQEIGMAGLGGGNQTVQRGLIIGGNLWKERILATSGSASLAAGPTWATLEAVLPMITYPSAA